MKPNDPYNSLIKKLEDFIRSYLRNRLYRGIFLSLLMIASYVILVNTIEYFGYLPGNIRFLILMGFLSLMFTVLTIYVFIPVFQLLNFRKFLSHDEAARIIGEKLPEVSDKLINLLQLKNESQISKEENILLSEAITQKSTSLQQVPFVEAIDWSTTKRFLKWSLYPLGLLVMILLAYPSLIVTPATRILQYNTVFEKPLPYRVEILSLPLETLHNQDFELKISVNGEEIPDRFFILTGGMQIEMERKYAIEFVHIFRKVTRDINFQIKGGKYLSNMYKITARTRPRLMNYAVELVFPNYLKRQNEKIENPALLTLPVGTMIKWTITTRDATGLLVEYDSLVANLEDNGNICKFEMLVKKSSKLIVYGKNEYVTDEPLVAVVLDAIPDEFPIITVSDLQEENLSRKRFFSGYVIDDYGFTKLEAIITIKDENTSDKNSHTKYIRLFLEPNQNRQNFYFTLDLDTLGLKAGQEINIKFRVTDNDHFTGPKSMVSQSFYYRLPTDEILDSIRKEKEKALEYQISDIKKSSERLKKEIQNLSKRLLQKPQPDQYDRALINDIVKQKLSLQQQMEYLRRERETLNKFSKENDLLNERLLEKQVMIDKLIEEVLPDELRKMMEEIEKLLDQVNKDQLTDFLKRIENSSEKLEQMLDRNLSLLKQLQFEKEMNALIERLDKLSQNLKDNAENTVNTKKEQIKNVIENLENINQKFSTEQRILDSLRKINPQLEQPFMQNDTKMLEKEILQDIEQSKELLKKNDNKGSSGQQRRASEKIKQLKNQLSSLMQMSAEEQLAEDARMLRYLLENVLRLSFQQEGLIERINKLRRDDPSYSLIARSQSMLADAFKVVEDSLNALAKRQPMVGNFVIDEVQKIKNKISEAQDKMKERLTSEATSAQQFAMMSLNNLSLMLAESLKNIEESMGMPSTGKGKGKSKKPSPGNSIQRMREMQEALGKQLQETIKENQKGQGRSGMSEEIARMAAQQEALRQQLQKIIDEMKSEGQMGGNGLNNILQDMEKLEERLVNRYLDEQTLRLQRNIEVRMLESEKALKEREQEERRESFEFKGENIGNVINEKEYERVLKKQREMLRTNPIDLNPFLKDRAKTYFILFNQTNAGIITSIPSNR